MRHSAHCVILQVHALRFLRRRADPPSIPEMRNEITTVEVFERALVLSVDERAQLATQLLHSLEVSVDAEPTSAEQIKARFMALDARFVAVTRKLQPPGDDKNDNDEPFDAARLA